ncbi:MAG TPA: DUF3037 domain-containing protein [Ohtaekwangia sp.]|uniref:DUF3037 domain-containing protein n=1 Tax=Ohtaekwangia sp. TaxID=2066019 RepID=UPI002F9215B3
MPDSHLFEYAVIRIVPKVEREEFINVGVILYCSAQKFLQARFDVNTDKVRALCKKTDLDELQGYIHSFERICQGGAAGGPIGKLPIAERFRWLTATRSTVLQTSKVHPGLCESAEEMLNHLFTQLVL